ncbi:hypothetical protein QVD17_19002 [Tagetes erecta]|uniref:Uncharacterized protein n=1 Tax=Tagetes erecta TaxID=13708 RepID=A0AAD8NWX3_TARER|nr:hypothetical protein QVD17_19002 [Tagetes erecta]
MYLLMNVIFSNNQPLVLSISPHFSSISQPNKFLNTNTKTNTHSTVVAGCFILFSLYTIFFPFISQLRLINLQLLMHIAQDVKGGWKQ